MATTRVSRNDLCPCRSGKKYKNCCLRIQPATSKNQLAAPPRSLQDGGSPNSFAPRQSAPRPAITTPLEKRDWQQVHVTLVEPTGDVVCAVVLHSREWLRSRDVALGGPIQLCIPQYEVRGEGRIEAINPSPTVPQGEGLVETFVRQKRKPEEESLPPVEKRDWQQVHVVLDEPDGKQVYVVVLHSREWLRRHGGLIGGPVYLNLRRHGVHGEGRITFVEPSPVISDGEGRVMTFVRGRRDANIPTEPAPMSSALSCPGVRTYFGERMPPVGHAWVRVEFDCGGDVMSDLTLTRSDEWMRTYGKALEALQRDQDIPLDAKHYNLIRVCVDVAAGKRVHIAFFWPARWVQVHGLTVGEPLFLRLPKEKLFGEGKLAAIESAPFVPRKGEAQGMMSVSGQYKIWDEATMASTEVGDYALTYTAEERGEEPVVDDLEGEWVVRQRVGLLLKKGDGGEVTVVLLRETEWVLSQGIEVGGVAYLDMPEQGTRGWARVQAVEPCLVFRRLGNPGVRMVTGTFRHSEGWAGDLKLKGESKPIRVTPGHLFWSVDRQDWVSVGELRPGETVKTLNGTTTVESYTMRDGPEAVYNLEVEHDHVFRVGDQGILVHNTSNPTAGTDYGCENKAGQGRLDPCESGLLNTKLGGCKTDYQAHHLIACSVRSSVALKRAAQLGFDINGMINGWCLPSLEPEAKATGLPLHSGRHMSGTGGDPNYFVCVQSLLAGLDRDYNRGAVTDCNLCAAVASVAAKIRDALAAHRIWLQNADPNKGATWQCPTYS
ncbi:MAG TPA: AHH domain-containing protein [Gemmataceae bacterium]|nr:AHH domain-containing protein [Gemmataceae bacterium]